MHDRHDPAPPSSGTGTDTRIVYGARCVWWDSIDKASSNDVGLPCCPHCRGVLFQVESAVVWWTNIDTYAEAMGDPLYRAFMEWLRGKCFTSIDHARLEYRIAQMEKHYAEPRDPKARP